MYQKIRNILLSLAAMAFLAMLTLHANNLHLETAYYGQLKNQTGSDFRLKKPDPKAGVRLRTRSRHRPVFKL